MSNLRESFRKQIMLREHLLYNFVPGFPRPFVGVVIDIFSDYWKGLLCMDELSQNTGIPIDDLYSRFDYFLNADDLDYDLDFE